MLELIADVLEVDDELAVTVDKVVYKLVVKVVDCVEDCTPKKAPGVDKVVDDPTRTKVSVLMVAGEPTIVTVTVLSTVLLGDPDKDVDEGGDTTLKPVAIGLKE